MSMTPDAIQMLLQSLQGGTPEPPGQQERVSALRGQQALGILGTMGGKNLAPFGQNMYSGASNEIKDIEGRQDKQLGRSLQALQGAKVAKDLMADPKEQARYSVVSDGVGGFLRLDKFTGATEKIAGVTIGDNKEYDFSSGIPPNLGKLTEPQSNSAIYSMNAAPAIGSIRKMLDEGFDPSFRDKLFFETGGEGMKGSAAALMASEEGHRYVTYAKHLINAIMRRESGAAIPEAEWSTAVQRFIPMPWDSAELRKVKLDNAEAAVRNIGATTGPASDYIQQFITYHARPGSKSKKGGDNSEIVDLPPRR